MISLVMFHVVPSSIMRKPIFSLFSFQLCDFFFSDRETQDWETTLRGGISFSFSGEVTLQVSEKRNQGKLLFLIIGYNKNKIGKLYLQQWLEQKQLQKRIKNTSKKNNSHLWTFYWLKTKVHQIRKSKNLITFVFYVLQQKIIEVSIS